MKKKEEDQRQGENIIENEIEIGYHERGHGCKAQGLEAAEVGVGEEGTEQGREVAGPVPDIDESGGRDPFHVEHNRQINHHVRGCSNCSQLFKCLIPCKSNSTSITAHSQAQSYHSYEILLDTRIICTNNIRHGLDSSVLLWLFIFWCCLCPCLLHFHTCSLSIPLSPFLPI